MIAYLEGTVSYKGLDSIVLLTGGVGYKVFVPSTMLATLNLSTAHQVFIHTHVKEEALDLYGFARMQDLALFELFLKVSGIGPKTALGIFSAGSFETIRRAILASDVEFFLQVPRLGKKNAQKLIIELRPKLTNSQDTDIPVGQETGEILAALQSFGFHAHEAREALQHVQIDTNDISTTIKAALKYLGRTPK